MKATELSQETATPELGGKYFGDLKLILKPNLSVEQKKRSRDYMKFGFDKESHKKYGYFDIEEFHKESEVFLKGLIVGWENFVDKEDKPIPFTDKARAKYLDNFLEQETKFEKPFIPENPGDLPDPDREIEFYSLREYILEFTMDMENFVLD